MTSMFFSRQASAPAHPPVNGAGALANLDVARKPQSAALKVRDGAAIETEAQLVDSGLDFTLTSDPRDGQKKYDVAPHLKGKIVPVMRAGLRGPTCWIFSIRKYIGSDVIIEVGAEIRRHGFSLDVDFQVVEFGDMLLNQIADGRITPKGSKAKRDLRADPLNSRLADMFESIIQYGYAQGAADIDFRYVRNSDKSYVGFSIDSKWVYPEIYRIDSEMLLRMLSLAFQEGQGQAENAIELSKEQQLKYLVTLANNNPVMLRWASLAGDTIYSVTVRIQPYGANSVPQIAKLGYLPNQLNAFRRAITSDGGAVIFSGVVNSGKSTSLSAMVAAVPIEKKIITVEDPAEIFIPGVLSNTVSRAITGEESLQLQAKLATLKRTGYNGLLLGEIRDRETGRAAQDVFESGQKLYTTVHGAAAWKIPDRLAGPAIGIPREALAVPGNLRLLVYQALIATNCKHCARPLSELMSHGDEHQQSDGRVYIERLKRLYDADLSNVRIRNPEGCPVCRREGMPALNGYKGRTPVAEIIEPDEEFCELVSKANGVGMLRYLERLRGDAPYNSENMDGKSAMDCGIYKMLVEGTIDPRELESRFSTFEQIELERERKAKRGYL